MKFIITFGSNQIPGINYYTEIDAKDRNDAREKVYDALGSKWAFLYESEKDAGIDRYNLTYIPFVHIVNMVNTAKRY